MPAFPVNPDGKNGHGTCSKALNPEQTRKAAKGVRSLVVLNPASDIDLAHIDRQGETDAFAAAATATVAIRGVSTQPITAEEVLVVDARASLTPAQIVEQRLVTVLRQRSLVPLSHLRLGDLARGRR